MTGHVRVSVVIPARDASDTIGACLDSLAAQRDAPGFEVIVVDDASVDATAAIAAAHPLRPRLAAGPGVGSYAARNAGAALAAGTILAFTDADCRASPRWLAAGLSAIERGGFDLVGGGIAMTGGPPTGPARYDRGSYLDQEQFVTGQGFAATANLLVRRDVFERVRGFDPTLRSGGDLEFGRRATRAGARLGYAADALVEHPPRTSYAGLWALHRRLGAGWAALSRRGMGPPWWRDPALRLPTLGMVVERLAGTGEAVRRRQLVAAHLTARTARVVGRLSGR